MTRKSLIPVGTRVTFSGGGVNNRKRGTVVDRQAIKVDHRGVPTNDPGAYKPVDWSKEVAVMFDDGTFTTIYPNYLTKDPHYLTNEAKDKTMSIKEAVEYPEDYPEMGTFLEIALTEEQLDSYIADPKFGAIQLKKRFMKRLHFWTVQEIKEFLEDHRPAHYRDHETVASREYGFGKEPMAYPSLKEVFLREEEKPKQEKTAIAEGYIASIVMQLRRASTPTSIRQVASIHDKILLMLGQPEKLQQATLDKSDGFTRFHFRMAKKDVVSGKLDPLKAPTGKTLYQQEVARRKSLPKPNYNHPEPSQAEKDKSEVDAAYGSPSRPPWGLGT